MFGYRQNKDYSKLNERINMLESDLNKLRTEQIDVLAQLKMIRDKVLRRFRTEEEPQTENNIIKNPFLR